jgi:hypothetical protein
MKQIKLLMILFCFQVLPMKADTIRTNYPELIGKLMREYVNEGIVRGVYVENYLHDHINSIVLLPQDEINTMFDVDRKDDEGDLLGRVYFTKTEDGVRFNIILSSDLLLHTYAIRWVLWHELGHVLKLLDVEASEYSQPIIMSGETPLDYIFANHVSKEKWKLQNDLYWYQVKTEYRKRKPVLGSI